ncbi:DUF5704 domain-containing protein [Paenibacillus woosongensis]|uniref:DUF5704 domain-containing protein n=1 Tax=Paenibacillus woosongensis TaxID=307580 RepID=A0AA95KSG9_9BACL|nr:DUF5704 domain-containing protein [Paenibacillus woosongensis]WHX47543.1 DUF5704 domain-containing protein [Paenibacillus woosongensis]
MTVNYTGYVVEKKQIRVVENAVLQVNETKNMKAEVRTLDYTMADWNEKWFDVSIAPETAWSSSNEAVATVDSNGKVTAISEGTTTISADWKKGPYWLRGTATIRVGNGPPPPPGPDPDPLEPGVTCTTPSPGRTMSGEDFSPNVSAVIRADARGSERFNVLDGIPTTESLYGNVWAKNYLHQYGYQEMTGKCTFTVNVTVMPPPPPPDGQPGEPSTVQVQVDKNYSFWTVSQVEVYGLKEAALQNYAFEANGIRISPSGYNTPYFAITQTHRYEPSAVLDITVGADSDPEAAARSAVSVRVRNDTFTFNSETLMSGAETTGSGQAPSPIPTAAMTGDNILYSRENVIPMSKTNQEKRPSAGTVYYVQVNGAAERSYPIYGINPVTVHTPAVIYPAVSDDREHNQKTKPAAGRSAVILDRPFAIELPNSGQHANYLGYGSRNYLKYIGSKQVRFPFDVYDGSKTQFHPKNTWIEVEKSQESFSFFLPVWVDEGFYDVEFRTIAHNAPAGATHQRNANLDLTHHIAYDTVAVDVVGRVYDFRVTDIADYNWETVFRTAKGSSLPTGNVYWAGLGGIDGAPRGISSIYTLPIRPGSHPAYKNVAIKTGYHFKFDLKTKGNMFGIKDEIKITPSFYFISAEDGSRTPVELYYHKSGKSYVKVGSPGDEVNRYVVLNERLRNVSEEELTDTALYKYDYQYSFGQIANIGRPQFVSHYINFATKRRTAIGSLSLLRLPEGVRTFIGPKTNIPAGVDPGRANAAVQRWYGEYSLPADLYAVKAGTNVAEYGRTHRGLTDKSPIFLKNGYIVVNFNMETVREGQVTAPHLQYIHGPLVNQWHEMEGFARSVQDPFGVTYRLQDGDVVLYHAGLSSRDDFRSMVTH